jgi:hypothetical protein
LKRTSRFSDLPKISFFYKLLKNPIYLIRTDQTKIRCLRPGNRFLPFHKREKLSSNLFLVSWVIREGVRTVIDADPNASEIPLADSSTLFD